MKQIFSIEKKHLTEILGFLGCIMQKKTMDLLSNCFIISLNNNINFECTNMDQWAIYETNMKPNNIFLETNILIEYKTLFSIVKSFESTKIDFWKDNNQVVIFDKDTKFYLDIMNIEKPIRFNGEKKILAEVPPHIIKETISKANLTMDEEGIFILESNGESIVFTSRDRRRISFFSSIYKSNKFKVILKEKIKNEILNLCDLNENITFGEMGNEFFFQTNKRIIFSKKVILDYFEREKYFQMEGFFSLILNKKQIVKILKKQKTMVSLLTKCLELIFENNQLTFRVFTPSAGSCIETLDLNNNYLPLKIKLNIDYFLQSIELCEETFEFSFKNSFSPVFINNNHLIMPIRF